MLRDFNEKGQKEENEEVSRIRNGRTPPNPRPYAQARVTAANNFFTLASVQKPTHDYHRFRITTKLSKIRVVAKGLGWGSRFVRPQVGVSFPYFLVYR